MTLNSYLNAFGIPPPFNNPIETFWKLIEETVEAFNRKHKLTYHRVPDEPLDIIWISYFHTELNEWIAKFTHTRKEALRSYQTPAIFWVMMSAAFSTLEVRELHQKIYPIHIKENHLIDTHPKPAPHKISPEPTPKPKIKKPYQKSLRLKPVFRWASVRSHILERQPYPTAIKVYDEVYKYLRNKKSKWGKKVYPYGQAYIAKQTGLTLRQVVRCWQWLKNQGIFNKRKNENPKVHHSAEWFVCTSMKQVAYFRDPKNLHRKSKRQD